MDVNQCKDICERADSLLDQLQGLLEQEIACVRRGHAEPLGSFGRQTEPLVQEIVRAGFLQLPEFADRRAHLRQLYGSLSLMMTARKAEIGGELASLRKGRKMLRTYRNTI